MGRQEVAGRSPAELRRALGAGFAHDFAARITERLDVDVLVMDLVGDAYCLESAGQKVVVVKRTTSWFRQNFSLAHELGHIASDSLAHAGRAHDDTEAQANAFAAELLMPESDLRAINWQEVGLARLAGIVWDLGVSTDALWIRLETLGLAVSAQVSEGLGVTTFALLRRYLPVPGDEADPITRRRGRSAARWVPSQLASRLERAVMDGKAPPESLAFALGVPVEDLEVGEDPVALGDEEAELLRELLAQ